MKPAVLHHFSEDPAIERFVPHVPVTNPTHRPAVWAIDEAHSPLYWFPRDCPRVTVWPRNDSEAVSFAAAFVTAAPRVHAIEAAWLAALRSTQLYRYDFDASPFVPWPDATGQWISDSEITPIAVSPVGDLLHLHVVSGIELRIVPSLWPLHDQVVAGEWEFSIVRMLNAQPRPAAATDL